MPRAATSLALACLVALTGLATALPARAQDTVHPLAGMPLREIGPALTSGRVSDFAFQPGGNHVFYVAMASGGVWKTVNAGTTWTPIFDHEGAYATGVVEIDPHNPQAVWVGTGENNSQRSVGFGDGVYRSLDGGKSWTNMGLEDSGHISMIRFHPDEPGTVFVAAQGPLWNSGGERGLYRTVDGGETWQRILHIDADTGVNEFVLHANDPDTIVASSYQRRRHVWTLINGGPGSGLHKSTDGGRTWRELTAGLPKHDMGRIGLAAAPGEPDLLYAIIETDDEDEGVYRSTDFGESWEKRSSHMTTSPQYYNELVVDPNDPQRVYAVDTITHRSEDGGATWEPLSLQYRHVDDHALWIDPDNSAHWWIGGDGGVYETWDDGETFRHIQNLPVTQFYRATPDTDLPFYNVCAGTQDNHTLCGPTRTRYTDGITNADWWIARTGDGFKARFDPENPAIVYAQAQHGALVRFDRVTGERVAITPHPPSGEDDYKWNWNSPLIVSPHDPARLYYGAERLFRSDDRGDSWRALSGDLTRQVDRNALEVMGRVWSVDAVAKNNSTSMYGALIALDESPLVEGLLFVGTDDGRIGVSADGGDEWRYTDSIRGVPDGSLIEDIVASRHDADVVYAVVDNHKRGDHAPYVLRSDDRGRSWRSIASNLPARGTAHALAEDHLDPDLLFVGTEFGVFFTNDGGEAWHELTSLPTIAVRDLEIQRRENDLVVGTFGRGVWILDDYDALRTGAADLDAPTLFSTRDAWLFIPDDRRGWGGLGDYGHAKFSAANPAHGAVFSYYLPEALETRRERRRAAERERAEAGGDNPYPSWDALRAEDREEAPSVVLTVRDAGGAVVRRIEGPVGAGFHRVAWDLRYPAPDPVNLSPSPATAPWHTDPQGPLATPGRYTVTLSQRVEGTLTDLAGPRDFVVKALFDGEGLVTDDREALLAFQQRVAALYRAVRGADEAADEYDARIAHLRAAADATRAAGEAEAQAVRALATRMADLRVALNGDGTIASRQEPTPLSITARVGRILDGHWASQAAPTGTHRDSLAVAEREFTGVLDGLRAVQADLAALEERLEALGAPWTPGRLPSWPPPGGF